MNLSDLRADGIKNSENSGVCITEVGASPRPKRKRGHHRALKRGEPWAVTRQQMNDMINSMSRDILSMSRDILSIWYPTALDFIGQSRWDGFFEGLKK